MKDAAGSWRFWAPFVACLSLCFVTSLDPLTPASGSAVDGPESQLRSSSALPAMVHQQLLMQQVWESVEDPPGPPPAGSNLGATDVSSAATSSAPLLLLERRNVDVTVMLRQQLEQRVIRQQQRRQQLEQTALRAEIAQSIQQGWRNYPAVTVSGTSMGPQHTVIPRTSVTLSPLLHPTSALCSQPSFTGWLQVGDAPVVAAADPQAGPLANPLPAPAPHQVVDELKELKSSRASHVKGTEERAAIDSQITVLQNRVHQATFRAGRARQADEQAAAATAQISLLQAQVSDLQQSNDALEQLLSVVARPVPELSGDARRMASMVADRDLWLPELFRPEATLFHPISQFGWCEQTPLNGIGEVTNPFTINEIKCDKTIKPLPCGPARNGRRKVFGRFKSRMELVSNIIAKGANGSTIGNTRCSKCGVAGHNSKSCGRGMRA
ncbi:hypothetical protein T484DRAFT_3629101 [Baffinella frigidus]|nr:hypothetical protein T484DRAFT_3629101 [Cryptophyta sp. CCMP2293]